jgi:acetyl-CoA carboxylase biotin carboxyl carrier protein
MTIEEIRELLRIFNESGVGELELQQGKDRLRIRKAVAGDSAADAAPPEIIAAPTVPAAPPSAPQAPAPSEAAEPEGGRVLVKSPIVGTFYESPSPGSPAFVKVGDTVEPGQVLCIIESMKLMNEIEAEVGGVVAAKLVENGRPVEYGEALFAIEPR